ncbi:hypothetical protein GYMC10_3068 [Paenibacillus sp. Y412MC10]|nr:hypothetical protein GYMC10_3068 [Paenibacillus sp. Y412MC10]
MIPTGGNEMAKEVLVYQKLVYPLQIDVNVSMQFHVG